VHQTLLRPHCQDHPAFSSLCAYKISSSIYVSILPSLCFQLTSHSLPSRAFLQLLPVPSFSLSHSLFLYFFLSLSLPPDGFPCSSVAVKKEGSEPVSALPLPPCTLIGCSSSHRVQSVADPRCPSIPLNLSTNVSSASDFRLCLSSRFHLFFLPSSPILSSRRHPPLYRHRECRLDSWFGCSQQTSEGGGGRPFRAHASPEAATHPQTAEQASVCEGTMLPLPSHDCLLSG
jgi:hypothetical protein